MQNFASSSTLGILVDLVTIVFMLGLMFWLDWDFTLIAIGVTPFLLLFVMRFKKAVKEVTHEVRACSRATSSPWSSEGLGSVRVVKAFGRQDLERAHMQAASQATVEAALQGAAGQVAAVAGRQRSSSRFAPAIVLWRGTALIVAGRDDGRRADGLPRVPEQVLQAGAGSREDDEHDRADHGRARADPEDPRRRPASSPSSPTPPIPAPLKGEITFEHVAFGYGDEAPVLQRRQLHDQAGPGGRDRRADRQRQIDGREPDSALLRSRPAGAC